MSSRAPFFEHPSRLSMFLPMETLHRSSNFCFPLPSCLLVGPSGLEPPTLRLSGARSSQLSYGPIFRTRTTSIQEMTFSLASMPCTNFYVFCVRPDFWFSRAFRVQASTFPLVSDAYNVHTGDDVSHKSFRPLHRVRRAGFEPSRFRVPRCASQPPDAVWWR